MINLSDTDKEQLINDMYDDLNDYLESNPVVDITIDKSDTDDYHENGLHCSKLGWCVRSEVMSYFNYPKKPVNLQTKLTFMRGNFYHELVYKWIDNSSRYEPILREISVTPNLPKPYRGTFDIFFWDTSENFTILADIKTANSNMFKKYSSFLPKEDNIKQLTAYYEALNKSIRYIPDELLMMYFSSGSDHPQFYFVEPYADIDIEMNKYIQAVEQYLVTEELPPRLDATFNTNQAWQCGYCSFINTSCEGLIGEKQKKTRSKK